MITWLGVTAALRFGLIPSGPPALLASLATLPLGIVVIFAYVRYLRETDELRRKIELEALALAYGVGLVGTMTYFLLQVAGYTSRMDFLVIALLMIVSYSAGNFLGRRRYA